MPRSCSAARRCHGADRRRFHRHAHRRVTPHGGAGSYRPRERSQTRPCPHKTKYIRSPRPEVRNVPTPTLVPPADRPESNAADTAAFPPRQGQGPRLAQFSLRAMDCALSPDSPPPSTATGLAGDHLVAIRAGHRAAFTHAAQLWQAEYVAWAAWCAVAVVTTTRGGGVTWLGSSRPLPRRWCWPRPTTSCWTRPAASPSRGLGMLATSRPSQLLTRRPTGPLHARTEAQAPGDADVCYNFSPASDGLRHIRRRRQSAGLPAVPGRS